MLACRACRAPPMHSHVCSKHIEWALTIGTLINTIRSILVYPKGNTPDAQKCVWYTRWSAQNTPSHTVHRCDTQDASYEDEKPSQPQEPTISQMWENTVRTNTTNNKGHCLSTRREEMWLKRKVREASEIKIVQLAMNCDQEYELPHLR